MNKITAEQTQAIMEKKAFLGNWIRSMRLKPEQASKYVQKQVQLADDVMNGARMVKMDTPSGAKALVNIKDGAPLQPGMGAVSGGSSFGDKLTKSFLENTAGHATGSLKELSGRRGLDDVASSYVIQNPQGLMGKFENLIFGERNVMAHELAEANALAQHRALDGNDAMMYLYRGIRVPKPVTNMIDKFVGSRHDLDTLKLITSQIPRDSSGRLLLGSPVGMHVHPSVYIAESLGKTSPLQHARAQFMRWWGGEGPIVKKSLQNPSLASDLSKTTPEILGQFGIPFDTITRPDGTTMWAHNIRKGLFS